MFIHCPEAHDPRHQAEEKKDHKKPHDDSQKMNRRNAKHTPRKKHRNEK